MAGKKRLSNREKRLREEVRKELQDKGMLPPDKPRLNRKKFVEGAEAAWNARDMECHIWEVYLMQAFGYVLAHIGRRGTSPTLEAVGAAKVLMVALRLREFDKMLNELGQEQYKLIDQYKFVKDILDA